MTGVQVQFDASATRAVLGVPAAALAGAVVDLADILPAPAADALVGRLNGAADWPGRLGALFDTLRGRLRAGPDRPAADPVRLAWTLLTDARRPRSVAQVAQAVGWHRRHLFARVAEYGEPGGAPEEQRSDT